MLEHCGWEVRTRNTFLEVAPLVVQNRNGHISTPRLCGQIALGCSTQ